MDTDALSGQRMAEFARGVEVLRDRPGHVQGADFVPPPPSWAGAVDVAASLMEPQWDRLWSKPTDHDALNALAITIYAVGGDAARELLAGLDVPGANRHLAEPRLIEAVSTALTGAGHDLADAQDAVAAAWAHLIADRGQQSMAAPDFLYQTSLPEMFGDPGPESLLFRALPTMARATAPG